MTSNRRTEGFGNAFSGGGNGGGGSSSGGANANGGRSLTETFNQASDSRMRSVGPIHVETYTPPKRTENPKYPDHYFTSRQAETNSGDLIGKTTHIHNRSDGSIVASTHGKNGKAPSTSGFNQGLFNWISGKK